MSRERKMRRRLTVLALGSFALASLEGCAINPRPTFEETSAVVKTRTGLETTWMRSEADEVAVITRVREVLKSPLTPRNAA